MTTPISSFSGLNSGIQWANLVDQIIQVEGQPIALLKTRETQQTNRKTQLATYKGLLNTFQTAVTALRTGTGFTSFTTTASGTTAGGRPLFFATAGTGAVASQYQVEVDTLAAAAKIGSTSQTSATTPLNLAGAFTVNGQTVTVVATDALNDIRDKINAVDLGTTASKVSASILTVSGTSNKMILTSDVTGSTGITLADTTGAVLGTLGLLAPGAIVTAGADATFKIDGTDFVRTTNIVADALQGVTLTLQNAEVGSQGTLSVSPSSDGALKAAQAFVDAYNQVMTFIQTQNKPSDTSPAPLFNDGMLRANRSTFSGGMLDIIEGSPANATTGATAGFSLSESGTLSLDASKFSSAFAAGSADLRSLFTTTGTGLDAIATSLTDLVSFGSGLIDSRSTSIDTSVLSMDNHITQLQGQLDRRKAALTAQFVQMETIIGRLQSQGSFLTSQFTPTTLTSSSTRSSP